MSAGVQPGQSIRDVIAKRIDIDDQIRINGEPFPYLVGADISIEDGEWPYVVLRIPAQSVHIHPGKLHTGVAISVEPAEHGHTSRVYIELGEPQPAPTPTTGCSALLHAEQLMSDPSPQCEARKPYTPQQGERCSMLPHPDWMPHSWVPWTEAIRLQALNRPA